MDSHHDAHFVNPQTSLKMAYKDRQGVSFKTRYWATSTPVWNLENIDFLNLMYKIIEENQMHSGSNT